MRSLSIRREALLKIKAKATKVPTATMQLRLYVSGQMTKSLAAISNLRAICREHLYNRCQIEVIDLAKNPSMAIQHQILAVPTLVRTLPISKRTIIGELSDTERVLIGLEIRTSKEQNRSAMD
jgi:circadian clock protein KaiB